MRAVELALRTDVDAMASHPHEFVPGRVMLRESSVLRVV